MAVARLGALVAWALLSILGCGDDATPAGDAGPPDTGPPDAGGPRRIEDLPLSNERSLPGLSGAVEVVRDVRGYPHVYARTLADAVEVQGYLEARDRMGGLVLARLSTAGRTSELGGSLSPTIVENDIRARFYSHRRIAQAQYDALATTSELRVLLDAFARGVNAHIAELRSGTAVLPRGVSALLSPDQIEDWSPVDSLQAWQQVTQDVADIGRAGDLAFTRSLVSFRAAFAPDDPDPRIAALSGAFDDLTSYGALEKVYSRDGFPGVTMPTSARLPAVPPRLPSSAALTAATRFFADAEVQRRLAHASGSNEWAVDGAHAEGGAALLATDPHTQLATPPYNWHVHLNTIRFGDGADPIDAMGMAYQGLPGIARGFTRDVAWGGTAPVADNLDLYDETIVPGTGGAPDGVRFRGGVVPLERRDEVIRLDTGAEVRFAIEVVPHHGPLMPEIRAGRVVPRTGTEAISMRWTGFETHDPERIVPVAWLGFMRARSVDDVRVALERVEVNEASIVAADRAGHIFWSSRTRMPVRDPRAMTYDPADVAGYSPCMVLPGDGDYEWLGDMEEQFQPGDVNPARGFLATANNDLVGTSRDMNPFNDAHYYQCYADNLRIARIDERLTELTMRGNVTAAEMQALQGDHFALAARWTNEHFVAALDRALDEAATPGTHTDLTAVVTEAGPEGMADLGRMRARLEGWSFEAAAGVESPTPQEIADSVAESIHAVSLTRLVRLVLADELSRYDTVAANPYDGLHYLLAAPETLRSYDAARSDSRLWDDLGTPVVETRSERLVRAVLEARAFLRVVLGPDMEQWRWGRLHTVRIVSIVPSYGGEVLAIPPPGDPTWPNGWPRPGDGFGIDASYYPWFGPGLGPTTDFSYRHGPNHRLVVALGASGPRAWDVMASGQSEDPDSPHHADEAELWWHNQAPELWFEEADVVANAEARERYTP